MQEVKFLLREVGESAMSAAELEEYIAYNFTSKGYELFHQAPFPVMENGKIKSVQLFMTFVKNPVMVVSQWTQGEVGGQSEMTVTETPKKRGRPVKVE